MVLTPPLTLEQRIKRSLEEDATTVLATTTLMSGVFAAREYARAPVAQRHAVLALRKTLPFVPAFFASAAFGVIGIKLTVGAIQDMRRDYSRTSVLIAVPVFAALLHAPLGLRVMAKSAVGYGSFVCAADYAASKWHHYQAQQREQHVLSHSTAHDETPVFIPHSFDHPAPSALLFTQHEPAPLRVPYRG